MTSPPDPMVTMSSKRSRDGTGWVVSTLLTLYCVACFVRVGPTWPTWSREASGFLSRQLYWLVDRIAQTLGAAFVQPPLHRHGLYLLLAVAVIPWLLMALVGRGHPRDIGCRFPNRFGWHIALVGYVLSLPLLAWMVRSDRFGDSYLRQLELNGSLAFTVYYFVNMLSEHFFLHGIVLGACRRGGRWPPAAPTTLRPARGFGRLLQWLGLAVPMDNATGLRRATRWIGLPDGCVRAVAVSSLMFALIHLGKDPRELLLSIPGGIALAYIALRTNTWLVPFLLHLATAGTAWLLVLAQLRPQT